MTSKITAFIILIASSLSLQGQVQYLRLSPVQKITQRVGMTDVTIEFSRPQMKGREIFGSLVPYDKMWRTGANENTKISFSHRVKVGETEVASGTYALFTQPHEESWEIYLYTDTSNLDVPNQIDSTKLIYLTTVASYEFPRQQETLVINIYDITETTANLGISWDKTAVRIPMSFYTHEVMEQMIDKEFKQNIFDYSIAASYYAQRNINLERAKKLQEVAMRLREAPSAWAYHEYGITLKKLGEKEKAINAMEYSIKLATEIGNEFLIKENTRLISELRGG